MANGALGFAPAAPAESFSCLFSAGTAGGTYSQPGQTGGPRAALELHGGSFTLRRLSLPAGVSGATLHTTLGGADVPATASEDGAAILFDPPLVLEPGAALQVGYVPK